MCQSLLSLTPLPTLPFINVGHRPNVRGLTVFTLDSVSTFYGQNSVAFQNYDLQQQDEPLTSIGTPTAHQLNQAKRFSMQKTLVRSGSATRTASINASITLQALPPVRPCAPQTGTSHVCTPVPSPSTPSQAPCPINTSPQPAIVPVAAQSSRQGKPWKRWIPSCNATNVLLTVVLLVMTIILLRPQLQNYKLSEWTAVKDFRDDCRMSNVGM
jgi:hypothetical protein